MRPAIALELLEECLRDDLRARAPTRDPELAALVDAFEGMPPAPTGVPPGRAAARTNRDLAAACRELVARIDAGRNRGERGG